MNIEQTALLNIAGYMLVIDVGPLNINNPHIFSTPISIFAKYP
jgi:hypothetical protein